MACDIDGIEGGEEDFALYNPLDPLYHKTTMWNGRSVEKNEGTVNPFFKKDLPFPSLPNPREDIPPLKREVENLSIQIYSDWEIAQPLPLHISNSSELATLEEILYSAGYTYDTQQSVQILTCKSNWMKFRHGTKKVYKKVAHKVKKGAKETFDFVMDHKKEIIIGTACIVTGVGVAYIAKDLIVEAGSVLLGALMPSKKKEEEDEPKHPHCPPPQPHIDTSIIAAQTLPDKSQDPGSIVNPFNLNPEPLASPITPMQENLIRHEMDHLFSSTSKVHHNPQIAPPSNPFPIPKTNHKPYLPPIGSNLDPFSQGCYIPSREFNIPQKDSPHQRDQSNPIHSIPPVNEPSFFNGMLHRIIGTIKEGLEMMGREESDPEIDMLISKISPEQHLENRQIAQFANTVVEGLKNTLETIGHGIIDSDDLELSAYKDLIAPQECIPPSKAVVEKPQPPVPLSSIINTPWKHDSVKWILEPLSRQLNIKERSDLHALEKQYPHLELGAVKNVLDSLGEISISPLSLVDHHLLQMGYNFSLEPNQSIAFETSGCDIEGLLITDVNGMANKLFQAIENAEHIHQFCPNIKMHCVYNHTNTIGVDVAEALLVNPSGFCPNTERLLRDKWIEFHIKNLNRPNAKILHFCHSQGALITKKTLEGLPEEIRNRIIVVAIAPADIVPDELCFQSFNYASEFSRDLIPSTGTAVKLLGASSLEGEDRVNILERIISDASQLIRLEAHPDAPWWDHALQSPTYAGKIEDRIKDYMLHNGEYTLPIGK